MRMHAFMHPQAVSHAWAQCRCPSILGGPATALESVTRRWFVEPLFLRFGDALCVKQAYDCTHARVPGASPFGHFGQLSP